MLTCLDFISYEHTPPFPSYQRSWSSKDKLIYWFLNCNTWKGKFVTDFLYRGKYVSTLSHINSAELRTCLLRDARSEVSSSFTSIRSAPQYTGCRKSSETVKKRKEGKHNLIPDPQSELSCCMICVLWFLQLSRTFPASPTSPAPVTSSTLSSRNPPVVGVHVMRLEGWQPGGGSTVERITRGRLGVRQKASRSIQGV